MPIHGRHFDPGHGQLPILLSERRLRLDHGPACLIRTKRTAALAMRQPAVLWQQTIASPLTPLYATADGGAIATSTPQCTQPVVNGTPCNPGPLGTLYTLDQNGSITSQTPDSGAEYSWTGQWYDAPPSGGMISSGLIASLDPAASFSSFGDGNPSHSKVAVRLVQAKMFVPINMFGEGRTNEMQNPAWETGDRSLVTLVVPLERSFEE
jgi:hypothetical protein